jgi:sugar lactone lactonase YvrE
VTGGQTRTYVKCSIHMIRFVLPRSVRAAGAALRLPLAVAALASCHRGPSAAVIAAETSGTLIVTIVTPPNVQFPSVTVTGPASFSETIAGTDTLLDLAAGAYTVTAAPVASTDEVVSTVYTGIVTGSPVNVIIDDTSNASVSYTPRAGTGGLWVGSTNGGSPVADLYSAGELRAGQTAGVSIGVTDAFEVIDALGNLWVASHSANTITEYLSTGLGASGSPAAAVTISGAGLNGPDGLAFDFAGDLWVSNAAGNTVVEYTAEQLAGSGSPAPAVVISGSALASPARPTFDTFGNLWVPNPGANTVVQFSPAQLSAGGSLTPAITLSADSESLDRPDALAFDTNGDLWVANLSNNTIAEYSPGQLLAGGALAPAGVLAVTGSAVGLAALAFDNSGDLWTASSSTGQLLEFTADQVIGAGAQTPGLTIAVAAGPSTLAFNPAPDGLPIASPDAVRLSRAAGHVHRRR